MNGKPRSISWPHGAGASAARPVCSSNAARAVWTSAAAGERGRSPASSRRGGPRPPSASRLTTATTPVAVRRRARRTARRRAPPNAPPSVERKTSVCVGSERPSRRPAGARVGAGELEQRGRARGVVVRAGAGAGVVAVGHHDDRVAASARATAITFASVDLPAARDRRPRSGRSRHVEAVSSVAGRETSAAAPARLGVPGRAVRDTTWRDRGELEPRQSASKAGGRPRRRQRWRLRDGEGGDEQRDADEEPRAAVRAGR